MRIGYCSPFNPMRSGISDFSEEVVIKLKLHCEVVIFSPVSIADQEWAKEFEWHLLSELDNKSIRDSLDTIVYHVGNNYACHGEIVAYMMKYPGILELHDMALHHFAAEQTFAKHGPDSYLELVEYCHGAKGLEIAKKFLEGKTRAPWEEQGLNMCMNRRIIESANGVIVHSELAKQMVLGVCPEMPITCIMHHSEEIVQSIQDMQKECRKVLNLPENKLIFGMFGFATSSKRVIPILDALQLYKEKVTDDFLYYIVGQPQKELEIPEAISKRGLEKNVHVTGFTTLEQFKLYMGSCDFCLNLRYPTQGESSGSLHRMLGMGKPIVVTDVGAFTDYPDNVALKVQYDENEVDSIYKAICTLTEEKGKTREKFSKAAWQFAKDYCDMEKNAVLYCEFFDQIVHNTWHPDNCDIMIGRLCELGLADDAYVERMAGLMDNLGLL